MSKISSLRWKFMSVIAAGTVMATLLAAAGFSWRDLDRFWERTSAEVTTLASIVSSQLGAAVMLRDQQAAGEILNSLRTDGRITRATVYDDQGRCFAVLLRLGKPECTPRPPDGIVRQSDSLLVTRSVIAGDERIGTLSLTADVPTIGAVVRQYIAGSSLVIAISLILSALLAFLLQARVTEPILVIANIAREMARTRKFGKRVPVSSSDEVGALGLSLNLMLEQLEERDNELALHRERLERDIAERNRVNTELHHAKERAESAARIKAEFLANMSHEIRTPLNGVFGMIHLATAACTDTGVREQLGYAETAAASLINIVNDILDFSRADAGKMTLESINFRLPKIIEECLQLFALAARERKLDIGFTLVGSCPEWVYGDPVRLRQILVNLVGNAVKFTLEGSVHLNVSLSAKDCIRFEVSDTGIGIPPDKLQAIFEPFTQADGSHARKFGGSGLGLAISQRLVNLMGGRLWAESEPGRGSRFFAELPLPAGIEEQVPATLTPNAEVPRLKVLIAEDNLVNQKVICGLLRRMDWPVTVVNDGAKAFLEFQANTFDLVLMDVQMPGVDGLDSTRMIRAEEQRRFLRRTPILALTAHSSPAQHAVCLDCGMDGVVVKPVVLKDLLARIHGVLQINKPNARIVSQQREPALL